MLPFLSYRGPDTKTLFKPNRTLFMPFSLRPLALVPFLLLGACKASVETQLPPQPPMWVVSDADSEITLYPTLHILPKDVAWKSDEMAKRLAEAEEVWFEIMPGSDADPALQQSMMQLGLAPGTSLSANLTETEIEALKAATAPLGMPFEAVDMMRPWMASTMASIGALVENGFDPNSGVEKQLQPMLTGQKIRALETAESQMKMLSSFSEDIQMEMLKQTLADMDEITIILGEMVTDWSVGDVEDLEEDLIEEMKIELPTVYNAVFTKRNQNWADQIEIEMKGSGTDFIAVGAGHLVGDDSVQAILKSRGYTVKRL